MSTLALKQKINHYNNQVYTNTLCVQKLDRRHIKITDQENYQILWLENGVRSIEIDFENLESFPCSIIFLHPGKEVNLRFDCLQPKGWILRFSHNYFKHLVSQNLENLSSGVRLCTIDASFAQISQ